MDDTLIFGYEFSKGNLQTITELSDNIVEEKENLWLHLNINSKKAVEWIEKQKIIPKNIREALFDDDTRPRFLEEENGIFLTLRGINFNEESEMEDMVVLQMWVSKNMLITVRDEKIKTITEMKENLDKRKSFDGNLTDILVEICERMTEKIADITFEIYEKVDELEEDLFEKSEKEFRSNIANIRRNIVGLRRFIVPQKEVFAKLIISKSNIISKSEKKDLREVYERVLRIIEDLNAARERAAVTQEEFNGKMADQMNKTMYVLAIVSTLFLPLSFITGLLGINVGGMPGIENANAFYIVCIIISILAVLEYIWFKLKKII